VEQLHANAPLPFSGWERPNLCEGLPGASAYLTPPMGADLFSRRFRVRHREKTQVRMKNYNFFAWLCFTEFGKILS